MTIKQHKEKMEIKKENRKQYARVSYTPEEDVDFSDVRYLKTGRARMGDHSGYTGTELRAIRREKGVGRPV